MDQVNCKAMQATAVGLRQVKTCLVPGIFYSMTAVRSETNRKFQTSGMTLAVLDVWSLVLGQVFLYYPTPSWVTNFSSI
jgi:hypothetical protein